MKTASDDKWRSYFHDIGIAPLIYDDYIVDVRAFRSKKVPPIFEWHHLALLTSTNLPSLCAMIFGTASFYRNFKIRKRSGGFREIRAPYPSLLSIQRWILDNILVNVPTSKSAVGFKTGSSIVGNAKLHCKRAHLAKTDIVDFFHSVSEERVQKIFMALGYSYGVSFALARLCTLDGRLPQGAATSPALSNITCRSMDARITAFCRTRSLRYTRYADDITISGNELDYKDFAFILSIMSDSGFRVNSSKTFVLKNGRRRIVTGIDITSGKPRVPREFRRQIQKDIYFAWSSGLESHLARRKIFAPNYVDSLRGRLDFWRSVEPDNEMLGRLSKRMREIEENLKRVRATGV